MLDWKKVNAAHRNFQGQIATTFQDILFLREFLLVIDLMNPAVIVETGTDLGTTTRLLAEFFPYTPIHTCDLYVRPVFSQPTIRFKQQHSVQFLQELTKIEDTFYFLDAHAMAEACPLKVEVEIIVSSNTSAVICAHDFRVPGKPQVIENRPPTDWFGYNTHADQDIDIDWLLPVLKDYEVWFPYYSPMFCYPNISVPTSKNEGLCWYNPRGRVYISVKGQYPFFKELERMGVLWKYE